MKRRTFFLNVAAGSTAAVAATRVYPPWYRVWTLRIYDSYDDYRDYSMHYHGHYDWTLLDVVHIDNEKSVTKTLVLTPDGKEVMRFSGFPLLVDKSGPGKNEFSMRTVEYINGREIDRWEPPAKKE